MKNSLTLTFQSVKICINKKGVLQMVKKRIGLDIDEEKHFKLKMLALKKKITLTELVEGALNELLESEKAEAGTDE